jgi:spore maturation protein CgeB
VKASGVGVLDEELEAHVSAFPGSVCKVFWDVDAPTTLERIANDPADPFHRVLKQFDLVLTYGGGKRVTDEYQQRGAKQCHAIYNALDPDVHHPVEPEARFRGDLAFLGNRLPDREARVDEFFFRTAQQVPEKCFLLGGNGWADKPMPGNVTYLGHVYTKDHNALNCSAKAVLNISRDSMARYGFSPATRVFEAAGAAACLITDEWDGIDHFFSPGKELLVARDGNEVTRITRELDPSQARAIGDAARKRVIADHTYEGRGVLVEAILKEQLSRIRQFMMWQTTEMNV